MSKNGKSSLTPNAKKAAERFRAKAFAKALRIDKFGPQMETKVADLCHEAWASGYFYAKQEIIKTIGTITDEHIDRLESLIGLVEDEWGEYDDYLCEELLEYIKELKHKQL